jgi:hypothetical protein
MFEDYRLSAFPPFAKLFIGIFATLMLLVCGWAVTIFYVEKGMVEEGERPLYLTREGKADEGIEQQEGADVYAEDSSTVLAPIWDSDFAGQEVPVDSLTESEYLRQRYLEMTAEQDEEHGEHSHFRENIGLAHTHINGQTLLFFAMGLVFLFTSAAPRIKKATFWIFGVSVVVHAIGLTGEGYHWFFDTILAISGMAILAAIVYMAIWIYVDLSRSASKGPDSKVPGVQGS